MKVRVFASLRQIAGGPYLEADGSTVRQLLEDAARRHGPRLEGQLRHCKILLNDRVVDDLDQPVGETDELAILPPVAGGDRWPPVAGGAREARAQRWQAGQK